MQQEQDQTDDQDNVDEACGYVKCEKSEQPENDEDRGDYAKHFFISLHPDAGTSARLWRRGSRMIEVCGRTVHKKQNRRYLRGDWFGFVHS
jgi:hypothetical protein